MRSGTGLTEGKLSVWMGGSKTGPLRLRMAGIMNKWMVRMANQGLKQVVFGGVEDSVLTVQCGGVSKLYWIRKWVGNNAVLRSDCLKKV